MTESSPARPVKTLLPAQPKPSLAEGEAAVPSVPVPADASPPWLSILHQVAKAINKQVGPTLVPTLAVWDIPQTADPVATAKSTTHPPILSGFGVADREYSTEQRLAAWRSLIAQPMQPLMLQRQPSGDAIVVSHAQRHSQPHAENESIQAAMVILVRPNFERSLAEIALQRVALEMQFRPGTSIASATHLLRLAIAQIEKTTWIPLPVAIQKFRQSATQATGAAQHKFQAVSPAAASHRSPANLLAASPTRRENQGDTPTKKSSSQHHATGEVLFPSVARSEFSAFGSFSSGSPNPPNPATTSEPLSNQRQHIHSGAQGHSGAPEHSGAQEQPDAREQSGGQELFGGRGHLDFGSTARAAPTVAALQRFVRQVHRSLDPQETAYAIANESRALLECDRVSVLAPTRGSFTITAVSGHATLNRRSKWSKNLTKLANATLATGQAFGYPSEQTLANEIQVPLNEYLLESNARSLIILPITQQDITLNAEKPDLRSLADNTNPVIAGLVIESLQQEIAWAADHQAMNLVWQIGGDALRGAHQHHNLFLYPLWRFLGQTRAVVMARKVPVAVIAAAVALGLLALCFWPSTFYVSSEGRLVPTVQQRIFAPLDGIVEQVRVKPNQNVTAGQTVLTMRNYDLEAQLQQTELELAVVQEQMRVQERRLRDSSTSARPLDREQDTPLSVLRKQEQNFAQRRELLQQKLALSEVRSPISGQVMTWNVDEELLKRPVPLGRLMMEVADTDGPWRLELQVPDRRVGHLLRAVENSEDALTVEFVIAAQPNARYFGKLEGFSLATSTSQELGSFVKVNVALDASTIQLLQNSTEVSAKIHCGQAPLGYVWLHDIFEFVEKKIFFFTW